MFKALHPIKGWMQRHEETETPELSAREVFENLLFACLGAICALIIGLGMFMDESARSPASTDARLVPLAQWPSAEALGDLPILE